MRKIAFSSGDFPPSVDDGTRYSRFRDLLTGTFGSVDLQRSSDRPFHMRLEFMPLGKVGLGLFEGTIDRIARSARNLASDQADNFSIGINRRKVPITVSQGRKEATLEHGAACLLSMREAGEVRSCFGQTWFALYFSRRQLLDRVANADDLISTHLDPDSEAMRHLGRHIEILHRDGGIGDDPALTELAGSTLLDLIALVLGPTRDMTEIARLRGLRAARLQQIASEIRTHFAEPGFSADGVAARLRLSTRYVQMILSEGGASFTERVLELRLQKSRALLMKPHNARLKVSEIALACGFNEVSYFNQRFRRRFGASPTQYRAAKRDIEVPLR